MGLCWNWIQICSKQGETAGEKLVDGGKLSKQAALGEVFHGSYSQISLMILAMSSLNDLLTQT
jgi:hypothetical protein